jgi:hypothetical protein
MAEHRERFIREIEPAHRHGPQTPLLAGALEHQPSFGISVRECKTRLVPLTTLNSALRETAVTEPPTLDGLRDDLPHVPEDVLRVGILTIGHGSG